MFETAASATRHVFFEQWRAAFGSTSPTRHTQHHADHAKSKGASPLALQAARVVGQSWNGPWAIATPPRKSP
jgi:hypothetical protein